ncbi:MAG: c-type cytochrome [Gallionella sp.]
MTMRSTLNMHSNHALAEKRHSRQSIPTGFLFAAVWFICATNAIAAPSGATLDGKTIYHDNCSVCHGDRGDGKSRAQNSFLVPPRNYTTPEAALELSRDRMIHSVTHGRPGTAMISWKTELSPQEIEAVVDHIRATFMRLNIKTNAERSRPSAELLASRGGQLYMNGCVMCHGETGARQVSGRMQPPPGDFTSPARIAKLTDMRMIDSITNGRPGTAMRPYGDKYSASDIKAVVDFIRAAYMSK